MIDYNGLELLQKRAVDVCVSKIRAGSRLTKLEGFAGTGKTTIAGVIAERSGMDAVYAAYTGKAAFVLTRKGYSAQTIHSLIMRYRGKSRDKRGNEELLFDLDRSKASGLARYLLVIDETSMIGQRLGADIMSLGVPVLAIGDPFQLPPVRDVPYFGGRPDYMLTDVIRNKGVVLDLATDIRENAKLFKRVLDKPEYDDIYSKASTSNKNGYMLFDQILVGRNETRHVGNIRMRNLYGYNGIVVPRERIVCLENNNWLGCYNGQQFTVLSASAGKGRGRDRIWANLDCGCNPDSWEMECATCGWNLGKEVPLWADEFAYMGNSVKRPDRQNSYMAIVATYGYVLTVNKAQGSEWNSVLVMDETSKLGGDNARWLYTAVTRAENDLAIIPC